MTPEGTTADFLPTRATLWLLYFLDPRNLGKKTRASYNNTMEDYEYRVIKLHAIYSRISVNFLVNISKY